MFSLKYFRISKYFLNSKELKEILAVIHWKDFQSCFNINFSKMKYFKDLQSIKNQMNELVCVYDDLQDRLYEIDRSWQNNLVFHGIKPDAGGVYESTDCLEAKIKGVLRTNLNIGREIPIVRLQRIFNGSDVRGYKPVIVNFQVSYTYKECNVFFGVLCR